MATLSLQTEKGALLARVSRKRGRGRVPYAQHAAGADSVVGISLVMDVRVCMTY